MIVRNEEDGTTLLKASKLSSYIQQSRQTHEYTVSEGEFFFIRQQPFPVVCGVVLAQQ